MLRGNPQLPAYVMSAKFTEEGGVFVCQKIVKSDAGADKDFFHFRNFAYFSQKLKIIAV